jgi:hypothetical protein
MIVGVHVGEAASCPRSPYSSVIPLIKLSIVISPPPPVSPESHVRLQSGIIWVPSPIRVRVRVRVRVR